MRKNIIQGVLGGLLVLALVFGFAGITKADVNPVTPSTNDINRTNGWAHVDQLSMGVGTTDLHFISTRAFYSCFEYRTDGDTTQILAENGGINYNTAIIDGLYPYICEFNSSETLTIPANEYVEVRMVFGAERDERFDWTRFEVETPPVVVASVNGGGHLLQGEEGAKRKDWFDVSFGGWVNQYSDDSLVADFQVNLHNVSVEGLDKSVFHGSDVAALNFFDGDDVSCNDAVNFTINGVWNGVPGYSMIFRAGDFGSPNTKDTVRVTIFQNENGIGPVVYDTWENWPGDFPNESTCVGTARTGLDTGNITITQ